VYNSDVV